MRPQPLAFVTVAALLFGACADDGEPVEPQPQPDTSTEEILPIETSSLGEGLAVDLPADWEVTPFAPDDETPGDADDGCTSLRAALGDGAATVDLQLNSTECSDREPTGRIGNGFHGVYVTLDDVADPSNVETHEVPAGTLATFTQDYYECTNSCADYQDHVGLLELDDPPDPDRPTLVLLSPRGELALDQLVALAEAVHPE